MNFIITLLLASITWAGPQCTDQPKEKWQDQETFKAKLLEQGYKIKKFKVTNGNCYEIYGWDKDQNKVEIYFNPITAEIVKKKNW
jgi:hypothetical protein